MEKINVGIIGAAGYTAGELLRILVHHPHVRITLAQSESQSGKPVTAVHKDLIGDTALTFSKEISSNADVYFLCKGHGESAKILADHPFLLSKKLIDLSQDYRLTGTHDFVYGSPEFNKKSIQKATHIANPGCFATCIQLSILPAVQAGIVQSELHISGITGSTGAGQAFSETSHFSWRQNNASVYKPLTHQHLLETGQSITHLKADFAYDVNFIPYRGAFSRGIICTTYFHTDATEKQLQDVYGHAYAHQPFTHVVSENPDIKQVANTNKALIHVMKVGSKAVIVCVIDNLLKGASGQAVQNMNLLFGLDEKTGLLLKSNAF